MIIGKNNDETNKLKNNNKEDSSKSEEDEVDDMKDEERILTSIEIDDVETLTGLIEKNVPCNYRNDYGQVALHYAAALDKLDCLQVLLDKATCKPDSSAEENADKTPVDITTGRGWTPLHYAAHNGNFKAVNMLLKAGADPTVRNDLGQIPLDITRNTNIRSLLWIAYAQHRQVKEPQSPSSQEM